MSSQLQPPDGGGGQGVSGGQPAGQSPAEPQTSKPPSLLSQQQQQQQQKQAGVVVEKKQEKAKVIVQPVHPPLSTSLPLLRQSDSPQPPAIIETTVPVNIRSGNLSSLKQPSVPIMTGVAAPTKPALGHPTPPPTAATTQAPVPPAPAAPTTQATAALPLSAAPPTVRPHTSSPAATATAPAVLPCQPRLAYPLTQPGTTMSLVAPTRITSTVAVAGVSVPPPTAAASVTALTAAGAAIQTQYIPSVQKLPPNSLPPGGEMPTPTHTKGGVAQTQAPHLPPSVTTVTHSMLAGPVSYLSGAPVGLQLPPGTHPFATQLPRGATSTALGLASTKAGITTALLTRAGVPQGAVATTTPFPQQQMYGYPRSHGQGQVHLLTQRAGSPGVLSAGTIPRAGSPAVSMATAQTHPIQEPLRFMIPTSQGAKPDLSAQAKVELKMVIKKDSSKPDAPAKADGKAEMRPSSRSDLLEKSGPAKKDGKKDGKTEERVGGVKLAVGPTAPPKGATPGDEVPKTDGRVEMRVDVRPIHRPGDPAAITSVGPRWPALPTRPGQGPTYLVSKEWAGLPAQSPGASHAGVLPSGHMMPHQVVTSVAGMLQTPTSVPHSSAHPILRAPTPSSAPSTQASQPQPTATSAGTIPVAKVYPRQQQQATHPTQGPQPSGAVNPPTQFLPVLPDQNAAATAAYIQMHRNSPGLPTTGTPATPGTVAVPSVPSSLPSTVSIATVPGTVGASGGVTPHAAGPGGAEVKMERPPFALSYYYHPEQLSYQHAAVMQQFPGRHNFNPMSSAAIRPPTVDGQHRFPLHPGAGINSPMAAAVAAAATHPGNMSGAPGRPGQLTMMVGADRRPHGLQGNTTPGVPTTSVGEGSADGSLPSFTMAQMGAGALAPGQGQVPLASVANQGASPRPSILRKRNNDSRKPVMASAVTSQPGSPGVKVEITRIPVTTNSPKPSDCLSSSQHSENSNASETSTDTAPLSTGSGPPSVASSSNVLPLRIKQESDTNGAMLDTPLPPSSSSSLAPGPHLPHHHLHHHHHHHHHENSLAPSVGGTEEVGPSPRKKPRKQQHVIATEHPMMLEDQSTDEEKETKQKVPFKLHKKEKKEKKNAAKAAAAAAAAAAASAEAEALKVVQFFKRPCPRLVDSYRQSWKPAHNHFERYSDVKPKEEKKIGIHEIANQRGILKKTDGWKIHHIAYQFDDLNTMEKDAYDEMKSFKDGLMGLNSKLKESEADKISELVQGSLQRSQYVMEYLEEAKGTILKMLDHRTKVAGIVKKHANKRHVKKKHSP